MLKKTNKQKKKKSKKANKETNKKMCLYGEEKQNHTLSWRNAVFRGRFFQSFLDSESSFLTQIR